MFVMSALQSYISFSYFFIMHMILFLTIKSLQDPCFFVHFITKSPRLKVNDVFYLSPVSLPRTVLLTVKKRFGSLDK